MASPLQQFEVKPLIPLNIAGYDLSFTNSALFMFLAVAVTAVLMLVPMRRATTIPGRLQSIPEIFYEFINGMVRDIIGPGGMKFLPFVFSIFMMVFMGNVLGLMPYSFTFTSHIIVTAVLGLTVFLAVTIMGIVNHGWHFLTLFAPAGVPKIMYLFLVPIEMISFMLRPITLAVRLCANMVAGHIILKVFALFSVQMGVVLGLGPMLFNMAVVALELLVACLQAYIFIILTCIYLKDAVELHH